jgi:hypothetical protein
MLEKHMDGYQIQEMAGIVSEVTVPAADANDAAVRTATIANSNKTQ